MSAIYNTLLLIHCYCSGSWVETYLMAFAVRRRNKTKWNFTWKSSGRCWPCNNVFENEHQFTSVPNEMCEHNTVKRSPTSIIFLFFFLNFFLFPALYIQLKCSLTVAYWDSRFSLFWRYRGWLYDLLTPCGLLVFTKILWESITSIFRVKATFKTTWPHNPEVRIRKPVQLFFYQVVKQLGSKWLTDWLTESDWVSALSGSTGASCF
jgi:hypothetical protein